MSSKLHNMYERNLFSGCMTETIVSVNSEATFQVL